MDLSGLAELIYTLLAVTVSAVFIVCYIAAAAGTKQGTGEHRRPFALLWGWCFGVVVAMISGWISLYYANNCGGFLLALVLGAILGGATAFGVARRMAS